MQTTGEGAVCGGPGDISRWLHQAGPGPLLPLGGVGQRGLIGGDGSAGPQARARAVKKPGGGNEAVSRII